MTASSNGRSTLAEGTTRAVMENVADGLYVADSRGRITSINSAGMSLLGYESRELLDRTHHGSTFSVGLPLNRRPHYRSFRADRR
jgi:PAS domain S-box-containing protein